MSTKRTSLFVYYHFEAKYLIFLLKNGLKLISRCLILAIFIHYLRAYPKIPEGLNNLTEEAIMSSYTCGVILPVCRSLGEV